MLLWNWLTAFSSMEEEIFLAAALGMSTYKKYWNLLIYFFTCSIKETWSLLSLLRNPVLKLDSDITNQSNRTLICCRTARKYNTSRNKMWENLRKSPAAATGGVLPEKVFLEISQNSQENTWARVSLHRCFPVNFVKFLRTPFLQNTLWRLLLNLLLHPACNWRIVQNLKIFQSYVKYFSIFPR